MRRWRKLVPASTLTNLADVANNTGEHLDHSFVACEPVGSDHRASRQCDSAPDRQAASSPKSRGPERQGARGVPAR